MQILHIHGALSMQGLQLAVAQQTDPLHARLVIPLMRQIWNPVVTQFACMMQSPMFWTDMDTLRIRIEKLCNWPDVIHVHAPILGMELVSSIMNAVKATGQLAPVIWQLTPSAECAAVGDFLHYSSYEFEREVVYPKTRESVLWEKLDATTCSHADLPPKWLKERLPHLHFDLLDIIKSGDPADGASQVQALDAFYEGIVGI